MAEFEKSVWKITLGGVVLLDFGDRLLGEPVMGWSKESEIVPLFRSVHPKICDRQNAHSTISWQRVVKHADLMAARAWRMSHAAAVQALGKGDMVIEIEGGQTWTLKNAIVNSGESASGRSVSVNATNSLMIYAAVGTAFEI